MDIYTFSIVLVTISLLVFIIIAMYGHSHRLQEDLRDMDEELVTLGNSVDHKTAQLESCRELLNEQYKERLACIQCTPSLRKRNP